MEMGGIEKEHFDTVGEQRKEGRKEERERDSESELECCHSLGFAG